MKCPNASTEPCAYPACGCHTPTRPQNCGTGHCSCIECPFEPTILAIDMPGPDITDETVARIEAEASQKDERWNAAYLAILPAAMQVQGWTIGDKKVATAEDRCQLAKLFADEAVTRMKGQ
jgi:hypothetical protein